MKALDISKHKTMLSNILIDIYKDDLLSSILGFKGGSASMFFYGLPRFSTDLDFDLVGDVDIDTVVEIITQLLEGKYDIKEQSNKHNTLFWLVSYGDGLSNIKIEVSTREKPYDMYEVKTLYGIKMRVSRIGDIIANKMVATLERSVVANRDLFDIYFFLGSKYVNDINYEIVSYRKDKSPFEFYDSLYKLVSKINNNTILNGLGEVLDENQKDWVKSKLKTELLGLIERQMEITNH